MGARSYSLGLGIGWRPELALPIDRYEGLGFVEVIAEGFDTPGPIPAPLERLRARGVAIVPHGISLSLGGAEPPDHARLAALGRLATRLGAPLVSEHIAFVRAGGVEAGHLLPLPRTREALDVLVANARAARRKLPVPLALENVAALLEWPGAEMDEATFLAEAVERADALLLLNVANVYANARNHGWDPLEYLDRLPLERLAYVHVAGGVERGGLYHDSHAHPVPAEVLGLLEEPLGACRRARSAPGARRPLPPGHRGHRRAGRHRGDRGARRRPAGGRPCRPRLRPASGWRSGWRPSCGPWPTGPRPRGVRPGPHPRHGRRLGSEARPERGPRLAFSGRRLGDRFGPLFAAFAAATRPPRHGGPLADGRAFARALADWGELPEAARVEVMAVNLRHAPRPTGSPRAAGRRWPSRCCTAPAAWSSLRGCPGSASAGWPSAWAVESALVGDAAYPLRGPAGRGAFGDRNKPKAMRRPPRPDRGRPSGPDTGARTWPGGRRSGSASGPGATGALPARSSAPAAP